MTHDQAMALVRGKTNKTTRKVGNNTHARITHDGSVAFTLHGTDVVTIHPDNTATLRTGGWYSVTTKDRMNLYAPVYVYQRKGDWFIRPRHGEWDMAIPFTDGMTVNQYMFL
jgi:hypothetical protein